MFIVSFICLFLTGVFDSISVVVRLTLEQVITPDRLRGRVSAINYVFIGFSNEFGAFESGASAALFGPVLSVVGGGIGTIVVVIAVAFMWPALRKIGPLHTLREDAVFWSGDLGHRCVRWDRRGAGLGFPSRRCPRGVVGPPGN